MTGLSHSNNILIENIISNIPQYIFWKNIDSRYLGCNLNFAHAVGLSDPKEIIGKLDIELPWGNQYANSYTEEDNRIINGEKIVDKEVNIVFADGIERIILVNKSPLIAPENHQIIAILGIFNDITVLRKNQIMLEKTMTQLASAHTLQTEFIQNMQHDLRTPTSGLMSMLEIFALKETDPEHRETLFLMHDAAKRVHEICSEIIDFENNSHHNDALVAKKLSIEHIVRGVVELSKPAAITRKLTLEFEIDPNVPAVLKSDPKRISRLLINLVGNAIKFTKVGGVHLRAKLIKLQDKDVIVQFEIKDTGIGIPADKKEMIYEQFTRLTPSNEGYYKGSGLGLNIVKRYVDDLEGEIDLHSELNKGTTFYVTLPFKKPLVEEIYDEDPISSQGIEKPLQKLTSSNGTSSATENTTSAESIKLLLIEDDPLARVAALSTLSASKALITTADNVAQAFLQLNANKFDLVISDLGLPDGSGNDIVSAVKKTSTALNYNTPFLALTAHSNPEKKAAAEHAGFLLVMTKPLTKERVLSIVDAYIHKKAVSESAQSEPVHLNTLSTIDLALGEELTSNTPGLAMELLGMLAAELPKEVLLIQRAYSKNDIKTLRELFHKMKGGLCYCGVPRLQQALSAVHDAVKEVAQVSQILPLFEQLYSEINVFLDAYQQLEKNHV